MDFNKMMTENFSNIDEILKFFKHCCTVHEGIDCNKQDCDIFLYLDPIQKVFDSNRTEDYKRNFFIAQWAKYPDVFTSMFQLRQKNILVEPFTESLTQIQRQIQLTTLYNKQKEIESKLNDLLNKSSEIL